MRTYNIKNICIDKYDPWSVIFEVTAFTIRLSENGFKSYTPGQLMFRRDIILPIKHTADWGLMCQRNQTQINNDKIRENNRRRLRLG